MKYGDMNHIIYSQFPSLKAVIDAEMDTFECYKPGANVLYGNVLNPYITELLRASDESDEIIKVFNFYEELALSDDEEVRNLLQVTLLEYLWDEPEIFRRAEKYMLPETKKVNNLINEYLNKPV